MSQPLSQFIALLFVIAAAWMTHLYIKGSGQ
jgi:hypothetical protein